MNDVITYEKFTVFYVYFHSFFLHFFLVLPFLHSTSKLLKHITFILPVNQKLRQKFLALLQEKVSILFPQGMIYQLFQSEV